MRRRVAVGLVAVAGVALAGVVTAGVAHSAPPTPATQTPTQTPTQPHTIRLFERDTQQASIDLGNHGTGLGDLFVFAGDLTNDTANGDKAGRAYGSCTTTSGDAKTPGVLLCDITLTLHGGQIQTQAAYDSTALYGGTIVPVAITGGTGDYRGIRGDGTAQVPDIKDPSAVVFVLNPNT
jgi:hypothetical protein